MARYGINVGYMVVTWDLRFMQIRLQALRASSCCRKLISIDGGQRGEEEERGTRGKTVVQGCKKTEKEKKRRRVRETEKARRE